jgi:hypothetical protein
MQGRAKWKAKAARPREQEKWIWKWILLWGCRLSSVAVVGGGFWVALRQPRLPKPILLVTSQQQEQDQEVDGAGIPYEAQNVIHSKMKKTKKRRYHYVPNQPINRNRIALARTSLKQFTTFLWTQLIFFSHFARTRGQDATVVGKIAAYLAHLRPQRFADTAKSLLSLVFSYIFMFGKALS